MNYEQAHGMVCGPCKAVASIINLAPPEVPSLSESSAVASALEGRG